MAVGCSWLNWIGATPSKELVKAERLFHDQKKCFMVQSSRPKLATNL